MNRIDRVVLGRLSSRIALTVTIVFGLIVMAESFDGPRFATLNDIGGPQLVVTSLAVSAARWSIRTLSVTVLIGAIIAVLDLQSKHELTVIRSGGSSIWRVMRAPALLLFVVGALIATFGESFTTELDRSINPNRARDSGAITEAGSLWLEQTGDGVRYVMLANRVQPGGMVLNDVAVFIQQGTPYQRIIAPEARLREGEWFFPTGTAYRLEGGPLALESYALSTSSTPEDLRVRLASTGDLTFFELGAALMGSLSDPLLQSAVATRFLRLVTLPVMLVGSLCIAFAFTAGYRRTNKYGAAVLYGIVLGFVVFLVTEMADRAGSAGVLDPTFAAVGPAFVALLIGLTVLLYKEDGRA